MPVEVRMDESAGSDGRTLYGYAALYDSPTDMGWYTEVIKPGAFDSVIATSDVRALLNHDPNHLLGRSNRGSGTLQLRSDAKGLYFELTPPAHRSDILELVQRGDLTQCSFAFEVEEQRWIENEGEQEVRELVKFLVLHDITLATYPAYADTSVAKRCKESLHDDRADTVPDEDTTALLERQKIEREAEERQRTLLLLELNMKQ